MQSPNRPQRPDEPRALTRRAALASIARRFAAVAVVAAGGHPPRSGSWARRRSYVHPEPRPGITAERVLPDDRVPAGARDAYAAARAFPAIFAGR